MAVDDVIERAADDVADGRAVDWRALAPRARSDEERERLECLRIVAAVADVHRSSIADESDPALEVTVGVPAAPGSEVEATWGRYR
jgi:hypothetical protein